MVRAGAVGSHLPASGLDIFGDLRKMNKRQLYYQVLNFAMIVSSALMIWKGLIVLTGSESPIVVVLRWVPPAVLLLPRTQEQRGQPKLGVLIG
ncbi:hypothetical protein J1605_022170 [Eschrichtius robustus]|uniref:Uncharacterized protein n=1 Tax=Eschrichtius robustus TaxID=9764 RepID=A0AB34HE09_ESCRO|nr:hypothetical protein J1605_022170 [Eschrichtius robustus]